MGFYKSFTYFSVEYVGLSEANVSHQSLVLLVFQSKSIYKRFDFLATTIYFFIENRQVFIF